MLSHLTCCDGFEVTAMQTARRVVDEISLEGDGEYFEKPSNIECPKVDVALVGGAAKNSASWMDC